MTARYNLATVNLEDLIGAAGAAELRSRIGALEA